MLENKSDQSLVECIAERVVRVRAGIAVACDKAGRNPEQIEIVTVTKRQPACLIRAAYQCGLRVFGENYAEEVLEKKQELADLSGVQWDMIGHVQSRKAKLLANEVQRLHSLDSEKLARLFTENRSAELPPLPVLLEVNVSGESSKAGLEGTDPKSWEQMLPLLDQVVSLSRLKLIGLMCMPPLQLDMEVNRLYFRKLRNLRDFLNTQRPELDLTELSMGTSSDFPIAIEEGATIIRLGEAILGPRPIRE
ncbi:MAG: YggS family pyridoxal phosphate-dependent enzyme [Anaerolineaceae bacterium]